MSECLAGMFDGDARLDSFWQGSVGGPEVLPGVPSPEESEESVVVCIGEVHVVIVRTNPPSNLLISLPPAVE